MFLHSNNIIGRGSSIHPITTRLLDDVFIQQQSNIVGRCFSTATIKYCWTMFLHSNNIIGRGSSVHPITIKNLMTSSTNRGRGNKI